MALERSGNPGEALAVFDAILKEIPGDPDATEGVRRIGKRGRATVR